MSKHQTIKQRLDKPVSDWCVWCLLIVLFSAIVLIILCPSLIGA